MGCGTYKAGLSYTGVLHPTSCNEQMPAQVQGYANGQTKTFNFNYGWCWCIEPR